MGGCWLHVAEKPSVAKELVKHLSQSSQNVHSIQSYSRFNSVTEFQSPMGLLNDLAGGAVPTMVVTSVTGHLMEMKFDDSMRSWESVDPKQLFSARIFKFVKEDNKPIEKNLQVYAARATKLVLWLDCDREGENIAHEVISVCIAANPRLTISRAKFSALTQRDIVHAINHLVAPDSRASEAVDARQEMDLRIGAAFTRLQTISLRSQFEGLPKVISFGPCQIPSLGFVVDRFLTKESFVPEAFYHIQVKHNDVYFAWANGRLFNHSAALSKFRMMLSGAGSSDDVNQGVNATVKNVRRQTIRKYSPFPLSTVTLQKLASTHLHISSERTMAMAESLYQEGFLSYPRTETETFTASDDELLQLIALQQQSTEWGGYAQALCDGNYRHPRAGRGNDNAHPPIHPTKFYDRGDERQPLYALVARHFLASSSHDGIGADCHVTIAIGPANFEEQFTTSGYAVIERKWLDVFPFERWTGKAVPNYNEGETFVPNAITLEQGNTTPPALLSEPALISLMDKHGIGTDATIAQHIKTIRDRGYVVVERGLFVPTNLGLALASVYEVVGEVRLLQPHLRSKTEKEMSDIVHGNRSKASVLEEACSLYSKIFTTVAESSNVFISTFSRHFASTSVNSGRVLSQQFSLCGLCGCNMSLVLVFEQRLAICTRCEQGNQQYPGPLRLPRNGELTAHSHTCPICNYGVVTVTNSTTKKVHTLCPKCFSTPPPSFNASVQHQQQNNVADIENSDKSGLGATMRCFQCSHRECPLAGGQEGSSVQLRTCPLCGNHPLRLRKAKNNTSVFIGCVGYPSCQYTVFLPRNQSCVPASSQCGACGSVLLSFTVAICDIIPAIGEVEFSICIWCDPRIQPNITVKEGTGGQQGQARGRLAGGKQVRRV